MSTPADIVVDATHLLEHAEQVWWVALRVGAMLMLAPMIGSHMIPGRVRLILALAIALTMAPLLPSAKPVVGVDAATLLAVLREMSIGAAIGFIFRIGFEAFAFAGELVAQGMGLSFAQMIDPLRGTQSDVMTQWFTAIAGLAFFAIDGHIAMLRVVFESYGVAAPGAAPAMTQMFAAIPAFFQSMLVAGVSMALPIVIAMLVVNISFGVLARTAPALNPISIGLPASLIAGLVMLIALVPRLIGPLQNWVVTVTAAAAAAVR